MLFAYIIALSCITLIFCHSIMKLNYKKDFLYFVLSNYILSFSFLIFFFYYKDIVLSLINIFFLMVNAGFLVYEIKESYNKYKFLSLPYFVYICFLFCIIFYLFLMNRFFCYRMNEVHFV